MTKTEATTHYNWGYWDAQADSAAGRDDRQCIPQGKLFCLPKWDKPYCAGYATGKEQPERVV